MNAEKHAVDKKIEEVHQVQLEKNDLKEAVVSFWQKAKTGKLIGARTLGITLALIIGIGLVIFLFRSGKEDVSRSWTDFNSTTSVKGLQKLIEENPKSPASRVARLQSARITFGPEGVAKLSDRDSEVRKKAVSNIEKARDELVKLAEEFKDDTTMKCQALSAAAEAELTLVGIPSEKNSAEFRGSVDKAAEHYKQVASIAGASTKAGEFATKKADDLLAKKETIVALGIALNSRLNTSGVLSPIAPSGLGTEKPPLPPLPNVPDLGPAPEKPAAAVVGGTAGVTVPKPEDKK